MRHSLPAFAMLLALWLAPGLWAGNRPLQIYFVDVEGGQATLIVSPLHQSLLVDTGWGDFNGRDAERIIAAAKAAHLKQLDYVLITHYHDDHVGGVTQLAQRIKIGEFVDHGPNREDSDDTRANYAAYQKVVAHAAHMTLQPGEGLPFKGIQVQVLTADGEFISTPLPGAGEANPYCADQPQWPVDKSENARSLGVLVTYGKFRFLDLGDLTKRKEVELVCPNNLVGTVDLFLISHHGMNLSNSKSLVWALHPRVAIMDNGAHKGGSPEAWQTVHDSPGLEGFWQLHRAEDAGPAHNVDERFIANLADKPDAGHFIKVQAERDGAFTVENARNKFAKTYGK
ncbi:MAG TPA: MBL fold metallo-hydrolase [Terriglobales bacterium]|nr:MBL fold metallo-hydrolase [Terriglobales bacterium]